MQLFHSLKNLIYVNILINYISLANCITWLLWTQSPDIDWARQDSERSKQFNIRDITVFEVIPFYSYRISISKNLNCIFISCLTYIFSYRKRNIHFAFMQVPLPIFELMHFPFLQLFKYEPLNYKFIYIGSLHTTYICFFSHEISHLVSCRLYDYFSIMLIWTPISWSLPFYPFS